MPLEQKTSPLLWLKINRIITDDLGANCLARAGWRWQWQWRVQPWGQIQGCWIPADIYQKWSVYSWYINKHCYKHSNLKLVRVINYVSASSSNLKELLKFWTGWEIPSNDLQVEVMEGNLPRSSTCFQKLFIPAHYTCYSEFERDMLTCISCNDTGFGLI